MLGWKAFQDLCVALAEEVLKRPVQSFLPSNDAGRDGAFVGTWTSAETSGSSTIQCKFTSKPDENLVLSALADELAKARALARKGLAEDYIILTNHPVTGQSDIAIREAFQAVGVGECRVFHRDWIVGHIRSSPKLRMLAPRLYGMGDLSDLLDARAYRQAELILSELGDTLQSLVVTEAYRKSARAVSEHGLVVLLGAPASGKSTIGAGLAIGAADTWDCHTIKTTSPADLRERINPDANQFFWVDDAWGSTQYQRDRTEQWNQVFPLMQAALKRGTRFLITSRDYIWNSAKEELKLQALPVLLKSQVVIDVEEFTVDEKAQIAYNHLKLGNQSRAFRSAVKPHLPGIVQRPGFLPEVARRLGDTFFTSNLSLAEHSLRTFFSNPRSFLAETIGQLDAESRGALAVVFLSDGAARTPVDEELLSRASSTFGAKEASVRAQLNGLRGSLLLLASDPHGPYWKYKHPTIGDAFAHYVALDPERIRLFLEGAKPETISHAVVCAGVELSGSPLLVPDSLLSVLVGRLSKLSTYMLASFMSYRASTVFNARMLDARPGFLDELRYYFYTPIADGVSTQLFVKLHQQGLLPPERRNDLVELVEAAVVDEADASFLQSGGLLSLLSVPERERILERAAEEVLGKVEDHVARCRKEWDSEYDPTDQFTTLEESIEQFAAACSPLVDAEAIKVRTTAAVLAATEAMQADYAPPVSNEGVAVQQSEVAKSPLEDLFRDVDE